MIKSFAREVTTLATCWRITLRNGKVLGFTDFVQDILFENLVYKSETGFYSSAIEMNTNLFIDNFEISGFLNSDLIKRSDVLDGFFDYAKIEVIVVNYQSPDQESKIITSGYFGKIKIKDEQFFAEITGLVDFLDKSINLIYSPTCRAQFGDEKCKVINRLKMSGTITEIVNDYEIVIDTVINNNLYGCGKLIVDNHHVSIKECYVSRVILGEKIPVIVKKGDACQLTAGCDKKFSTCCEQYNNALNFRGEPHIPCIEEMYQ